MMDYTKQIFEMLGVEPEEEFKLTAEGEVYNRIFKIDKDLHLFYRIISDNGWTAAFEHFTLKILRDELQIIKIPHPTAKEQLAIDYARACGFKWLAKDKNKTLAAYKEKPQKGTKEWLNTTNDFNDWIEIYLPISFISWEDEEPYEIEQKE